MGIGDRHEDNMMLWYGGGKTAPLLYFQLDFKHVFGNQTKGVDAPPLTVPARLKQSLEKFGMWSGSKAKPGLAELCVDAFRVLRRCSGTLRALSTEAFDGVSGGTPAAIERCGRPAALSAAPIPAPSAA